MEAMETFFLRDIINYSKETFFLSLVYTRINFSTRVSLHLVLAPV